MIDLDGDIDQGLFIPPGVAHGFAALTDILLWYLVDNYYNPPTSWAWPGTIPRSGPTGASSEPDPVEPGPEQPARDDHRRRSAPRMVDE